MGRKIAVFICKYPGINLGKEKEYSVFFIFQQGGTSSSNNIYWRGLSDFPIHKKLTRGAILKLFQNTASVNGTFIVLSPDTWLGNSENICGRIRKDVNVIDYRLLMSEYIIDE